MWRLSRIFFAVIWLLAGNASAIAQDQPIAELPSAAYFLALEPFYNGDFEGTAKAIKIAARQGTRTALDTVCYYAMIGECEYRMGRNSEALKQFDAALLVYLSDPSWMQRLSLAVAPTTPRRVNNRPVTWGRSTRNAGIASIPLYVSMVRRADLETSRQLNLPINLGAYRLAASEVARCAALAIRRKRDILGPHSAGDPTLEQMFAALTLSDRTANNWPASYNAILLGLTNVARGKAEQGIADLSRGLLIQEQFDHPLTSSALLELGKLAFEQEQIPAAIGFLHEATFTAAAFEQYDVMEEAFAIAAQIHILSKQPGIYPALVPAVDWSRKQSRLLEVSVGISLAEQLALSGESPRAASTLEQIRRTIGRSSIMGSSVGKRLNYVTSLVNFQSGNIDAGNAALNAAVSFQRLASTRLTRLNLVDSQFNAGLITERVAANHFEHLLQDPQAKDWLLDPVESICVTSSPMPPAAERWLMSSYQRNDLNMVLEVGDQIRRRRFHSSLDLGARLLSLRWTLDAAPELLPESSRLHRQHLMTIFPACAAMSRQTNEIRTQLREKLSKAANEQDEREISDLVSQLASISANQEVLLREIAIRREPADTIFPPLRRTAELQKLIPNKTAIWTFLILGKNVHSFLIDREQIAHWTVESPPTVRKELVGLLHALGQFDKNHILDDELINAGWREHSAALLSQLMRGADPAALQKYDELVIVPDGMLWYLPFELLPTGVEPGAEPMIMGKLVRYAPTINLAIRDHQPQRRNPTTAILPGKIWPKEEDDITEAAIRRLMEVTTNGFRIPSAVPTFPDWYGRACDQLVVLADVDRAGRGPYEWSPFQSIRGKGPVSLNNWLLLPWGGPDTIVLPGFHTAAENGLKQGGAGDDLFLPLCALMAGGSRTILISRWRTGGQTSHDLVREFVQEASHIHASDAWQRSVQLAIQGTLDPEREPRVRLKNANRELTTEHPFFWSGYVLVDSAGKNKE